MEMTFHQANKSNLQMIFNWLDEPHVQEFWDNSLEHRKDVELFVNGRIEPSSYFGGCFTYWIGEIDQIPFSFIMTSEVVNDKDLPQLWKETLSKTGKAYSIDFCIGNKDYLGKRLAAPTLLAFMDFFKSNRKEIQAFFIDPDESNPKAVRVYEKAGFEKVGSFKMTSDAFKGQTSWLMVKKVAQKP